MTNHHYKINPSNVTDVIKDKVQGTGNFLKELDKVFKKFKKNKSEIKKPWKTNVNIESETSRFEITNLFETKQIVLDVYDEMLPKPIHSITLSYKEFKELSKFIKKIS